MTTMRGDSLKKKKCNSDDLRSDEITDGYCTHHLFADYKEKPSCSLGMSQIFSGIA